MELFSKYINERQSGSNVLIKSFENIWLDKLDYEDEELINNMILRDGTKAVADKIIDVYVGIYGKKTFHHDLPTTNEFNNLIDWLIKTHNPKLADDVFNSFKQYIRTKGDVPSRDVDCFLCFKPAIELNNKIAEYRTSKQSKVFWKACAIIIEVFSKAVSGIKTLLYKKMYSEFGLDTSRIYTLPDYVDGMCKIFNKMGVKAAHYINKRWIDEYYHFKELVSGEIKESMNLKEYILNKFEIN